LPRPTVGEPYVDVDVGALGDIGQRETSAFAFAAQGKNSATSSTRPSSEHGRYRNFTG